MKNPVFLSLFLAAAGFSATGFAQSGGNTTVLKQAPDKPQTIIESQNGYVIVNGDTVVRPGERGYRKIVIDREDDAPGERGFGNMGRQQAPKARLGVITDPEKSKNGAYIREVQPGSPAQAAGLHSGDKILSVDGSAISDAEDLIAVIQSHSPEDTVKITYDRNGKRNNTIAYLEGAAPETGRNTPGIFGGPGDFGEELSRIFGGGMFGSNRNSDAPKIGLSVEERADGMGVKVLDLQPGGVAAQSGLKAGDIITRFGEDEISSPEMLQRSVRRRQGTEVTVRYQRNGKTLSTKLRVPQNLTKMDM